MTSKTNYDPGYISSFFDDYADCEWERLGRDAASRVNFLVHRHHLRQWVKSGDDVLDAGAGPGRFTIELARIGGNGHGGRHITGATRAKPAEGG